MKTLTLLINKENLNSGQISISVYQEGKDTHTQMKKTPNIGMWALNKLWWTGITILWSYLSMCIKSFKTFMLFDLAITHLEMYPKEIIKDAVRDLCSILSPTMLFIIMKN